MTLKQRTAMTLVDEKLSRIRHLDPVRYLGTVRRVQGLLIESDGPTASLDDLCYIEPGNGSSSIPAEVVGFRDHRLLLMALGNMSGIRPGDRVSTKHHTLKIGVGNQLLGRVIGGMGEPIDGRGPIRFKDEVSIRRDPPKPMKRRRITKPLGTGIRAVDTMLTCGRGQRMGIFSGSGVGKSVLLGMMARYTEADVSVIGLVGERGREVREFLEKDLGVEGLKRSVVVAVTSDRPSLERVKGAFIATAVAEYFRDQGKDVLLMMDSVTRVAQAQREVGLTVGEPPATKGYPPSVFAMLPKLLERSGTAEVGSITGLYTVLVEGDDLSEPVSDTVRSILDGHVVLSRKIADRGMYPAVDVLSSVSRVMIDVVDSKHMKAAQFLKEMMARYTEAEDLIHIGAYKKGSDPRIDLSLDMIAPIRKLLCQDINEGCSWEKGKEQLLAMAARA
jgi:flagellum-specific ATP synthase